MNPPEFKRLGWSHPDLYHMILLFKKPHFLIQCLTKTSPKIGG